MDPHFSGQYLTFTLRSAQYALPIRAVREVMEYGGITEVPLAPRAVPGVINLRGAVVPVVDLSVRFGGERSVAGRKTCVVIVEVAGEQAGTRDTLGVIVDGVNEAIHARDEQLEDRPLFGVGLRGDFVACMLNVDSGFIPVLDLSRVLAIAELELSSAARAEPTRALNLM